jgi:transposase
MPDFPLKEKEKQKLSVITNLLSKRITNGEAAKQLNLSIRQVQRLKIEVKKHGSLALTHKLTGKPSNHQLNQAIKLQAISLVKEKYSDFTPKFASEKLAEVDGLIVHPQTLRRWLIRVGLWKTQKQKRPEYHAWRERKGYFGELEQFDGSYHLWFEDRFLDENGYPQETCLLASIDDATSKITHAKFDFNESVVAVFNFWKEYVHLHGKPLAIYLDKFSTYKINYKMAVDNSELMTQFQKAMKLLSIQVINANSPEAKGRVERLFGTLQDRLVKELRLGSISSIAEANIFLKEFIPKFNAKFSVTPQKGGDVHRALSWKERINLKSIFSIRSQRKINFDYTIQFKNHFYQLEQIQPTTLRPKEKVLVEEWLNNTIHFKFKGYELKYFILPQKPKKIFRQPAIITTHPLNWKPPPDHPWRRYKNPTLKG